MAYSLLRRSNLFRSQSKRWIRLNNDEVGMDESRSALLCFVFNQFRCCCCLSLLSFGERCDASHQHIPSADSGASATTCRMTVFVQFQFESAEFWERIRHSDEEGTKTHGISFQIHRVERNQCHTRVRALLVRFPSE